MRVRFPSSAFGVGLLLLSVAPAALAQPADPAWSTTLYLQRSWPKQTETNQQIKDINAAFGARFQTWDDVANLNLGVQVLRQVQPAWQVGLQVDYSRGSLRGAQAVDTLAGPATLDFEQTYSLYADVLAVAQYLPLGRTGRWAPFLLAGAGLAYERDRTRLTLKNSSLDEALTVDNAGWFPVLSLGFGTDAYFTERRTWYLQCGASYSWARLKHSAPATGSLAPSPTVIADTDSTGPNLWLGLGRRF